MKSILLTIGGVIQILVIILHIGIFFGIASNSELAANVKVSSYIFNAAVATTVIFFAYVSLFRKRDMLNTNFGRVVSCFIAIFYLQRGIVEVFLRGFHLINLGLMIVIAALYIVVALPPKRETAS